MRVAILLTLSSTLALAACGTVLNETTDSIVVDRDTYTLRTQTIQQGDRTYQHTAAIVKGNPFTCLPDSPGSCEAAVREGLRPKSRFDF